MTPKNQKTSRYLAIETLCSLEKSGQPVSLIFSRALRSTPLAGKEHHLAMNLVYGVLRQYQYLDSVLQILCKQPIKKLPPFVHHTLTIALYQIFFLDRIPASAAVNESVKAIKKSRLPKRYQGFVNGVLRSSIRQKETLPDPGFDSQGKLIHNHPSWLTRRWEKKFGKETMAEICHSNNTQAPLVIRINPLKTTRDDYFNTLRESEEVQLATFAPDGLVLPAYHGAIPDLPGYEEGLFQVQDEGAQLVSYLLTPFRSSGSYLDGCAGLGGKTSHLIELAGNQAIQLIGVEPEERRLAKFQENLSRLHPKSKFTLFQGDLQEFRKTTHMQFDGILLDAPCSGTGVIGRHPDIRWNRKEADLKEYQKKQLGILNSGAELLKPGGVLVYVTCSLEDEENEEVIQSFLIDNADFSLTNCAEYLPEKASHLVENNFFCPYPQATIDGFFAARLVLKS